MKKTFALRQDRGPLENAFLLLVGVELLLMGCTGGRTGSRPPSIGCPQQPGNRALGEAESQAVMAGKYNREGSGAHTH